MSSLDKMLIRGIRSFDPNERQVIEFYTPLTLIVGKNGCGKTTIIESLKYATTGDLPPGTTKGGAFVHDPRINNESNVKGQVKLKFRNVNNQELVCTRSLQATATKTSVSIKTLESLLLTTDPETGNQHSITSRCAELDSELPVQLGVSRAVLEDVIFCHQEDSFWPLSEPMTLKKKFDDIFAATKYTKAHEEIKKIVKDRKAELREADARLDHVRSDKEKAEKVRNTLVSINEKMRAARARIAELDSGELDSVTKEMQDALETIQRAQNVETRIKQLEHEKHVLEHGLLSLQGEITVLHDSDEELQRKLDEQQRSVDNVENSEREIIQNKMSRSSELERLKQEHSELLTKRGQLNAEIEAQQRRIEARDQMIRDISRRHHFVGFENDVKFSEDQVTKFMDKLQRELSDVNTRTQQLRNSLHEKEQGFNSQIQELKSQLASVKESKRIASERMMSNSAKYSQLQRQMDQMDITPSMIEQSETNLKDKEDEITRQQQSIQALEADNSATEFGNQLSIHEREIMRLNDEMTRAHMQSDIRSRLKLKRTEKERKEEALKNKLIALRPEVLGKVIPESDSAARVFQKNDGSLPTSTELQELEIKVDIALRQTQDKLKKEQSSMDESTKELSLHQGKLNIITQNAEKLESIVEKERRAIKNALQDLDTGNEDTNLTELVALLDGVVHTARENMAHTQAMEQVYSSMAQRGSERRECPTCLRPFAGNEFEEFLEKVTHFLHRLLPEKLRSDAEELRKAEDALARAKQAEQPYLQLQRLQKDLAEAKENLEKMKSQKERLVDMVEVIASDYVVTESKVNDLNKVKTLVNEVIAVAKELNFIGNEIEGMEQELNMAGSTRSVEEIQKLQEGLQFKCTQIRRDMDRLNQDKMNRTQILSRLEAQARDLRENVNQLKYHMQERQRIRSQCEDIKKENDRLQKEIEASTHREADVMPRVSVLEDQLTDLRRSLQSKETDLMKERSDMQTSVDQMMLMKREMQSYFERNIERQLRNIDEQFQELDARIKQKQANMEALDQQLTDLKRRLADVQLAKRNIDDNLKCRTMERDIQKLEFQLNELRDRLSAFDRASYTAQMSRLQKRQEELFGEKSGLIGELKQLEAQSNSLNRDLAVEYEDIDARYRHMLIQNKTEAMALSDLEKYSKALDTAIMRYHSSKMAEINEIIRELWMKTYKGNDIDWIEIRSEAEGTKTQRQRYNYRVVMIKGHQELDMRGRCSAGQKVLACIIIRLALAETFCLNCGILALDEPTTNLDSENIESLANSLVEIIQTRRQQSNFQLIVITHDEEFMQALGRTEFCDYYWRVFKDENGFSNIERQNITDR